VTQQKLNRITKAGNKNIAKGQKRKLREERVKRDKRERNNGNPFLSFPLFNS
jgi:hypothetical protein